MEFNLVDLVMCIRMDHKAHPYELLLLLGSEFSTACRCRVCRWMSRDCICCPVRSACGWYSVFGQELSTDPDALRCHQKPPLPFAFSLSMPGETHEGPRGIECRLVVIGRAIPYLDMLLDAIVTILDKNTRQGRYEILQIASRDYQGTLQPLGDGGHITRAKNLVVLSVSGIMESRPWEFARIGIRLISPLRQFADGRQLRKFDFRLFARSLLRRISSLAYYYGEGSLDCDFRALSHQSGEIVCTDDHFVYETMSGGNKRLSGITGHGSFCGDFNGLMPFLVIGTYVNAGKAASFGMGRYEVIAANPP